MGLIGQYRAGALKRLMSPYHYLCQHINAATMGCPPFNHSFSRQYRTPLWCRKSTLLSSPNLPLLTSYANVLISGRPLRTSLFNQDFSKVSPSQFSSRQDHKTDQSLTSFQARVSEEHVCAVCSKGFKSSKELKIHMKRHQEKRFSCPFCPKKYLWKYQLNNHIRQALFLFISLWDSAIVLSKRRSFFGRY